MKSAVMATCAFVAFLEELSTTYSFARLAMFGKRTARKETSLHLLVHAFFKTRATALTDLI